MHLSSNNCQVIKAETTFDVLLSILLLAQRFYRYFNVLKSTVLSVLHSHLFSHWGRCDMMLNLACILIVAVYEYEEIKDRWRIRLISCKLWTLLVRCAHCISLFKEKNLLTAMHMNDITNITAVAELVIRPQIEFPGIRRYQPQTNHLLVAWHVRKTSCYALQSTVVPTLLIPWCVTVDDFQYLSDELAAHSPPHTLLSMHN